MKWSDGELIVRAKCFMTLTTAFIDGSTGLLPIYTCVYLLKVEQQVTRAADAFNINQNSIQLMLLLMRVFFIAHLLGAAFFWAGHSAGDDGWVLNYNDGAKAMGRHQAARI